MLLIVVSGLSFLRKPKMFRFVMFICIAVGQGIYFATHAATSHGYTHPDAKKQRHMFMGKSVVLNSLFIVFVFSEKLIHCPINMYLIEKEETSQNIYLK